MVDGDVTLLESLLTSEEADALLLSLLQGVSWQQDTIEMFGRRHPLPRLTAWYGDPGAEYTYSGLRNTPLPWTTALMVVKERVESAVGMCFNSVLLNQYRHGEDHMGWHADDEPELGEDPVIASVSVGAERTLRFKHRHRPDVGPVSLQLPHGSLLIMRAATQAHWLHAVPKRKRVYRPRVNLTFRRVGDRCPSGVTD